MNWFRSLRLAAQLNFAFALVALVSVVVGGFGVRSSLTLHEMMDDAYRNSTLSIVYTGSASLALSNCQRALGNCVLAPDPAYRKEQAEHMAGYRANTMEWVAKERATAVSDQEKEQWRNFD